MLRQGDLDTGKPFRHPCIADVIQEYLFDKRREWLSDFDHSIKEEWNGQIIERVPLPLVCLVATAVRIFLLLVYLLLILCLDSCRAEGSEV